MPGEEKTLMSNKHKKRHLIPSVTEMKIRSAIHTHQYGKKNHDW